MEIIIHVVNTRRRQFSNYCYLVEEVESRTHHGMRQYLRRL